MKKELTHERLRELMEYSPITGGFTWKVRIARHVRAGDIAGSRHAGYIRILMDGERYLAHRLVFFYMYGKWPKDQVDHINRVRNDNRLVNLREATSAENSRNRSLAKNNLSGVRGVFWDKAKNKWTAQIRVDDKSIFLGSFVDKNNAIVAREAANLEYGYSS